MGRKEGSGGAGGVGEGRPDLRPRRAVATPVVTAAALHTGSEEKSPPCGTVLAGATRLQPT